MPTNHLIVTVADTNGSPVAGAHVTLEGPTRERTTVETDEQGRARFDADPTAPATVTVIAPGLAPDVRAIGDGYPTRDDGVEQFVLGPAGWPHYYRGRVRVPFQPVLDAVGARVVPAADELTTDVDSLDAGLGETVRFDDPSVVVLRLPDLREESDDEFARDVSTVRAGRLDEAVRRLNDRADEVPNVEQVGALVALTERGASFLTDTIVISLLTDDVDPAALAARHGLEVAKRFTALPHTYVLRSADGAGYGLLDIVAAVAAEPGVRYAEPNLVHTAEEDAVTPNDFLFPQQWDHPIINTPDAWQILRDLNTANTFGDPAITIAVVDSGIDVGHPAFSGTLSDGTAKVSELFDFAAMAANNDAAGSDHGHACASAATGLTDNGEGQAGVAGNCHLIGVRRGGDEVRYSEMYLWLAGLDADSTTAGFPAQLGDGADVITNSIAFDRSVGSPISALMQDTFDALTDQGRGGLGTLLFFSAGNIDDDLDVTFHRPWSMHPRCFGVSASTLADDGITEVKAAYSSFGSTVDFCAPSNDDLPPTIHNPTAGYGAFSATRADAPDGTAIPGFAATTTALAQATNAGATAIDVVDVAGATVGGSVLIGPVGNQDSRGRTITAINAANRRITLDLALPAGFGNATPVVFAPRQYRSDFGGTSYATPVTAGVAALMLSANPQLNWDQVGEILRDTAVKIDTTNTDATGRWRDGNGLISTDAAYTGPHISEWYGHGRIDAAAAVRRAAWTVDLITEAIEFIDVPEGETTYRAVRVDVRSIHPSTVTAVGLPAAPFTMPLGASEALPGGADYNAVEEAYLWISYTGSTAGDTAAGSVTVRHEPTGADWTIPITANTVEPKSAAVMLVLDRSGSMNLASGVGANRRIDVLRYSAGILAEVAHEGDAVGVVGFDHDPVTVLVPPAGPLGPPSDPFDVTRTDVRSAISTYAVNPSGRTSIGDGIKIGQDELDPVSAYDVKASVVFTDGYENSAEFIADVAGSVTDRTYAVALGRAENIRPATLSQVTNGTGGYCVLTDDLDSDSRYKLAKYFLQVLAGVKSDQIVVDPPVTVPLGETVEVPFQLAETDVVADVIFLTQLPDAIEMTLVTPDGDVVDPMFMSGLSGRNYHRVGEEVVYYRLTLPAPIGGGAREGEWLARFRLDRRRLKEAVEKAEEEGAFTAEDVRRLFADGLTGILLVHASSNLRMAVGLTQDSLEPGATVGLVSTLTEYGVPVEGRARVEALVTDPAGGQQAIQLTEVAPGVFENAFATDHPGVWTVLFRAGGDTFRGTPFTREEVRTASVWRGADRYRPEEGPEPREKDPIKRRKAWQLIRHDEHLLGLLNDRLGAEGLSVDDLELTEA